MKTENTHIYCGQCGTIKPLIVGRPSGADVSGRYTHATDLLCGECNMVLATTYSKKGGSQTASRKSASRKNGKSKAKKTARQ